MKAVQETQISIFCMQKVPPSTLKSTLARSAGAGENYSNLDPPTYYPLGSPATAGAGGREIYTPSHVLWAAILPDPPVIP